MKQNHQTASKEIMHFRGKLVGTNMSKEELLEVIGYLAAEMHGYKVSAEKLGDFANEAFLSMKPKQGRKYVDKWIEAHHD